MIGMAIKGITFSQRLRPFLPSSAFASHLPTNETERSTQWEAAPPDGRGASSDSPHVPDKLEQDSDNTEHEHSNDQRCHCWGELLAFIERLGESTETFFVKFTQVRNPIADAGGPLGYPFTVDKGIDTCNPLESIILYLYLCYSRCFPANDAGPA